MTTAVPRATRYGVWFVSLFLTTLYIYRALTFPITIDEAFSFQYAVELDWEDVTADANFHPINSLWLHLCGRAHWLSEIMLRLPNVLAGIIFLRYAALLAHKLARGWILGAFVILVANPFVIELFCVARGYGIGLGAAAGMIYYGLLLWEAPSAFRQTLPLFLAWSLLCIFGNYAFAFLVCAALTTVCLRVWKHLNWFHIVLSAALLLPCFAFLGYVSTALREKGLLFFGGRGSFFGTTIASLLDTFAYDSAYGPLVASLACIALCVTAVLTAWSVALAVSGRRMQPTGCCLISMGTTLLALIFAAAVVDTLFLVERTATSLWFYFSCLLISQVSERLRPQDGGIRTRCVTGLYATFCGIHLLISMWRDTSFNWFTDLDVRTVLQTVEDTDPGAHKTIGVTAILEPAMQFYITKLELSVECVVIDQFIAIRDWNHTSLSGVYYGSSPPVVERRPELPELQSILKAAGYKWYYLLSCGLTHLPSDSNGMRLQFFSKSDTVLVFLN